MTFTEALRILQRRPADLTPFRVTLACGFTPLHMQTFLAAHLQRSLSERRVEITPGLFGDLAGTVDSLTSSSPDAAAMIMEWSDLDPRLGYRQSGGWGPADVADIVVSVRRALARLEQAVRRAAESTKIAVSLPTLRLPPVFSPPAGQASEPELRLMQSVAEWGVIVAGFPNVSVVSAQYLEEHSNPAGRFDFKTELLTGLPYTLVHADALAAALANLISPPAPKKGLITDLDDTLWNGILGDAGVEGVTWDLAGHGQVHGLYQQVLRALADQGTLIGIASKNDPELVDRAFARPGMLLPKEKVFPFEVHWQAKSGSVARILKIWNIGADSVVFVDDSPMELAEVGEAHPGIQCLRFPKDDPAAMVPFLREFRSLFGKSRVTEEDALRLDSLRQNADFQKIVGDGSAAPEAFLREMNASLTLDFDGAATDPRVLELVNKTNQFNLNGIRYTDADWRKQLERAGSFVVSVAYEDRFGRLGKIAVVQGRSCEGTLHIDTWVMSCRAFARRIEHQCLHVLFEKFGADSIRLNFAPTRKNGPTQDFLATLVGEKPAAPLDLSRDTFRNQCPALYHKVTSGAETVALSGPG